MCFPAQDSEICEKNPEDKLPPWSKKTSTSYWKSRHKANLKYTLSEERFDKTWLQTAQQLKTTGPFGTLGGKAEVGPIILALSCVAEATLHHHLCW